jgi:hypothetical protein
VRESATRAALEIMEERPAVIDFVPGLIVRFISREFEFLLQPAAFSETSTVE